MGVEAGIGNHAEGRRTAKDGVAMIRILHIVARMDRGGAETMLMNLYREIDRCQFQFDFVYFTDDHCDYDDEIEALGGQVYRLVASNPLGRFRALHALLKSGDWRVVHSHTMFSSGMHLAAARSAGVAQRVVHSHNTQDANSASLIGRCYQWIARKLITQAVTHRVACGAAAAVYMFPGRQDVILIPNAVDIDTFAFASGAAVRARLGIRDGQLVIVQVGRFMPVKNHIRSLAIAQNLHQAQVDFQLLLVGAGPEEARISGLVLERGLKDRVRLLGLRADIPELMAVADVMLMPSVHEGFPVVLVEAQAAGLPSVVSTAIPTEVELGLGMVRFIDLKAADSAWCRALQAAATARVPSADVRREVLTKAGFSAALGARTLERLYVTS